MVIVKLDISNAFGSLCARLVLDVLSGKASRDYAFGIKVDEEFETAVYELRAYFGFFKLARTCETILRYYSYDGATNYVKCKTGGIQGDPPEFMVFCHVTLHLWGRVFKMFPDLRGLAFADDGNIIGRLSQALRLIAASKPVFKLDGNLDFNLGKTMLLAKVPQLGTCMIGLNFFCRMTQAFRTLRMILLWTFRAGYRSTGDCHRHRHLHQGIRGAELCQDSNE